MDNNIKIYINTAQYKLPTQEDITSAKQFILQREEYARILEDKVDDCLANAAQQIVTICYKYNVDPQKFSISSQYNENMMIEIAEVMDNAEQEILDYIYEDSTSVTNNRSHINALIAWMATLGRGNKNLTDTLDDYLYKAMKDWEAAIATLRYANVSMATAVTKVKSYLHSIYTMPEVRAAFKNADDFNATYIRSRGVQKGGVGLSNNGSTNVTNMAKITLQMAWMKEQSMKYKEEGAAGYYVLRGSSYPCELCDSMVGFHKMEDIESYPPYHGHCCCYSIPIFTVNKEDKEYKNNNIINGSGRKTDDGIITDDFKQRRKQIKKMATTLKSAEFTNKNVDWKATISGAGINEWLNQPHKNIAQKNEMLLNLHELFANSDYLGPTSDSKNRHDVVKSHIFRTTIDKDLSWIIVHEMTWGEYKIHSISDNNPLKGTRSPKPSPS